MYWKIEPCYEEDADYAVLPADTEADHRTALEYAQGRLEYLWDEVGEGESATRSHQRLAAAYETRGKAPAPPPPHRAESDVAQGGRERTPSTSGETNFRPQRSYAMAAVETATAWAEDKRDPVELCEQLYLLLQGVVPKGYHIKPAELPKLSPKKAWTVVWWVQNQHREFPDIVERCDVCQAFYNTECSGTFVDVDSGPRHFCDDCQYTETCERQIRKEERAEQRRERAAKTAEAPR